MCCEAPLRLCVHFAQNGVHGRVLGAPCHQCDAEKIEIFDDLYKKIPRSFQPFSVVTVHEIAASFPFAKPTWIPCSSYKQYLFHHHSFRVLEFWLFVAKSAKVSEFILYVRFHFVLSTGRNRLVELHRCYQYRSGGRYYRNRIWGRAVLKVETHPLLFCGFLLIDGITKSFEVILATPHFSARVTFLLFRFYHALMAAHCDCSPQFLSNLGKFWFLLKL